LTLIVDAAPLVALADERDPAGPAVERLLREEQGALVVPSPVSAEVDYMLGRRLGRPARRAFLEDLSVARFLVADLGPDDYAAALRLDQRYADLDLGLADLSVVILAQRFDTRRLLTFDERDFRPVRPLQGGSFELLPADA
jgi:predicted nucleic acid-binding protein